MVKFQPTREWVNKENLLSFPPKNFFKFVLVLMCIQKAKHLDVSTMFTYSHANTPLSQSERVYYLTYFISKLNI